MIWGTLQPLRFPAALATPTWRPPLPAPGRRFTYPVASDPKGAVSAGYPVTGIPAAFVIGRDGKVAWQGHPMSGLEAAIEAALKGEAPKLE